MRIRRYRWHRWYAWHPVTIGNEQVAFEWVERCLMSTGRFLYRFPRKRHE